MSHEHSREEPSEEEVISMDELTEVLADATGESPEEIERGAEAIDFIPPEEAPVINK